MRFFHAFLVALLAIVITSGCQYNKCHNCKIVKPKPIVKEKKLTKEEKAKITEARQKKLDILQTQIKMTPLYTKWHHTLDEGTIDNLYYSEGLVLAETEKGKVYAFDRKDGTPLWVYNLEASLDFQPEVFEDKAYLLSQGMLHVLHKNSGEVLAKKILTFVPSSPLCVTNSYIFVGGWDNFIYALHLKKIFREVFSATTDYAEGDSSVKKDKYKIEDYVVEVAWRHRIAGNVEAKPTFMDGVVFAAATDEKIYAIHGQSGQGMTYYSQFQGKWLKWGGKGYYATKGSNIASIAAKRRPGLIYAGSKDYNLYCLSRDEGQLHWKYECQGEVSRQPKIIGNRVYVVSERVTENDSDLFIINAVNGEEKTKVRHGEKIFFIGKKYDWILRNDKRVAMVNDAGEVRNIFDLTNFDHFVSNVTLDQNRLGYAATKDGTIIALED